MTPVPSTDVAADLAAEVERLYARLAEVCPEHETCTDCGTALCISCDVGEPAYCRGLHCADCADRCDECQALAAADHHDEAGSRPQTPGTWGL